MRGHKWFCCIFWVAIGCAWTLNISDAAKQIGGAQYFFHVGQSRPLTIAITMVLVSFSVAALLFIRGRSNRYLHMAAIVLAVIYLINYAGLFLIGTTDGGLFVLFRRIIPTFSPFSKIGFLLPFLVLVLAKIRPVQSEKESP